MTPQQRFKALDDANWAQIERSCLPLLEKAMQQENPRPDFIRFNLTAAIAALTPVYNLADTEASPLTRDQQVRLGLAYQALTSLKREMGNELPAQD